MVSIAGLKFGIEELAGYAIFTLPVTAILLYVGLPFPGLNCTIQPVPCFLIGTIFSSAAGAIGFVTFPLVFMRKTGRRGGKR